MATIQELITLLPSADVLVGEFIRGLRKSKTSPRSQARKPDPLWARVHRQTGHGKGYSQAICVKYGFDPDETWIGECSG